MYLCQAHPDWAVDGACERTIWFFEKRKVSQHRHHCSWCHPKYRERGVRVRVSRFMEVHGANRVRTLFTSVGNEADRVGPP